MDDPDLQELIGGSEVTSVTFAVFYFVISGLKQLQHGSQRRWELRSSCKVGAIHAGSREPSGINASDPHTDCNLLVSMVCKNVAEADCNSDGLAIRLDDRHGVVIVRDPLTGMLADLDTFLIGPDGQQLEGSWAV